MRVGWFHYRSRMRDENALFRNFPRVSETEGTEASAFPSMAKHRHVLCLWSIANTKSASDNPEVCWFWS